MITGSGIRRMKEMQGMTDFAADRARITKDIEVIPVDYMIDHFMATNN